MSISEILHHCPKFNNIFGRLVTHFVLEFVLYIVYLNFDKGIALLDLPWMLLPKSWQHVCNLSIGLVLLHNFWTLLLRVAFINIALLGSISFKILKIWCLEIQGWVESKFGVERKKGGMGTWNGNLHMTLNVPWTMRSPLSLSTKFGLPYNFISCFLKIETHRKRLSG